MGYFRDDEARTIIRDTYAGVRSSDTAVARRLYTDEEIAAIPAEAVALALGVGHPSGTPACARARSSWTSVAEPASTPSWPLGRWDRREG
jgi:hypothetical protein